MLTCQLQALLQTRQLSRRAASRLTGLDRATIAKLCADRWAMIDRRTLVTLCQALRVTPGELLTYESTDPVEPADASD